MKLKFNILASAVVIYILMLIKCKGQGEVREQQILDSASLNRETVGLVLKANRKRYYISSDHCPGGVFFTRPVNENCICYNGVFQIVRECCNPKSTRLRSDNLELRLNFKCGSSSWINKADPIRAILPLAKPHNRFGSVIVARFFLGNNARTWRKFDTEDIIVGNNATVDIGVKTQFEIVSIKPLEKEIKIIFGKYSDMAVCYGGWQTEGGHQKLRVRIFQSGATIGSGCCFNVTRDNTPGKVRATCSTGLIITEIIVVQSVDTDIGHCDQAISAETPYTINNRKSAIDYKIHKITEKVSLDYAESDTNDIFENKESTLFKRQVTEQINLQPPIMTTTLSPLEGSNELQTTDEAILPRRKGISRASLQNQAKAINEFIAILRNDLLVEIREPQTCRFRLLKKSFEIFLTVIPNEVVPNLLMTTAFDVFFFLYEELEPIVCATSEMFNRTMRDLDRCLDKEQMLKFTTTGCPQQIDELIVDANVKGKLETYYRGQPEELNNVLKALKHVEIRKDRRFIAELHDVYVEINWKVVDFVHSLCFDYFAKEFNAHTYYETELETLFSHNDVKKRWFTERANLRYVRGIFPVTDLKLSIKQLDKVVAITHHISRYNGSYWLKRPNFATGYNPGKRPSTVYIELKNVSNAPTLKKKILVKRNTNKVSSVEKTVTYPYHFQEMLPAGEIIWDGMAVCLHAAYSNSQSYFVDSNMWGVTPSLFELGHFYT